jgi:hypothetical protein
MWCRLSGQNNIKMDYKEFDYNIEDKLEVPQCNTLTRFPGHINSHPRDVKSMVSSYQC